MEENTNQMHEMMSDSFGDNKFDKSMELNDSMSISGQAPDEYTKTIKNLGGGND